MILNFQKEVIAENVTIALGCFFRFIVTIVQ
jgi:hypothetical protein